MATSDNVVRAGLTPKFKDVDVLCNMLTCVALDLRDLGLGPHTILPSPILYGIWHTMRGSMGGRILRNGRAKVLQ